MDYENERREYRGHALSLDELDANPFVQFQRWMDEAAASLRDPTAMVLATTGSDGVPAQRIVLCKGFDANGFVFFTNYESDKARAMAENARVSLLFPWNAMDRQVIVGGVVEKLPQAAGRAYFSGRPRDSQIAAWASRQSQPLPSTETLTSLADKVRERFGEGDIPAPPFWGGYRVVPSRIEFWQGAEQRLNLRFRYTRDSQGDSVGSSWDIVQLQP